MFGEIIAIYLLISASSSLPYKEEYHEELYIKPLPSGHVNTYFQFTTRWQLEHEDDLHHTHLIPRAISEIIQEFDVRELHISLTQGLWRYETWGYPVLDAALGAEAWAWFSGNLTNDNVDLQWKNLCSTMAGILCTSLNFVDKTNSVEPKFSFRPKFGTIEKLRDEEKFIRYSTLPREIVCTENLTPWKKLLPCDTRTGLASLLNSGYVHNTNYHSLHVGVRTLCENKIGPGCIIEFTETANFVYDPKLLIGNDFSIRRMFGQGLNGVCPLAATTKVYVDITDGDYETAPVPAETFISQRGGIETRFAVFDIQKESPSGMFNIAWTKKQKDNAIATIKPPPLYAHRYIIGHGQETGKIVTKIINTHWDPLMIILQENIPWFVPTYLHTLTLKMGKTIIAPKVVHYIPGRQREKPYHLEIAFILPPKSTIDVSYDFDYIFLKWLEYPPDASHGQYLGSAIITTILHTGRNYTSVPVEGYLFAHSFNASSSEYILQLRTESLVLSLPIPDFSMPYNVICLACTVVALAFGPIHSVATKKIVIEKKDKPHTLLGKLKNKLFKTSETKVVPQETDKKEN